ncbi:hemagglutinin/amebocyte aggregation factor-like [Cyprinus carpio]|uniref:Hemagglutinin/amebocyte aggregation factor-like n=3 Tax=Cyprinus carpio TaxID=7962 RepID=A0A8C1Q8K0_CYPCA|nr:hemagglutinin/amebocyte aggregation factor-like [Cyprinus carpio]XP_018949937.1 hemagglutinin/amebocyte aggregation factor-like [Cyprinus carpio]XP_042578680.1 hemagglutinin/amebocyte aggregation factor-like [Cyprinus carpio]
MRKVALFLLLTGLFASGQNWHNNYDQPLNFQCPPGESISAISSYHNNYHEDRRWKFSCKPTFSWGTDCFLSPYVNDFDKTFSFECPPHHVIAGISSYHDNYHEDRRWQFSCCRSKCTSEVRGHCHSDCHWTSYVNSFDEYFFWTVPTQRVLVGIGSYHDDIHEDRRWRYKYCLQRSC